MNRFSLRQRGQAVVEALLMLPLLALLPWAISRIGGLQFSALEMAQASRKAVMAVALGQPLKDLGAAAAGPTVSGGARPLAGVAPQRVAALQDAWFDAGLQLLSAEARQAGPDSLRISRHTHVATGAGHAHGDADAQRRVGQAPESWRRAETASLAQARRLSSLVDRLDRPWQRPRLSLDWLSAWSDVVPADRLGSRGSWSK
ncbi:pilus assembly protein [Achromobacter agilis]|uniref:Pilus assembly protein TadE n=1 Tax=Achromobacter agilis TaxID=1353888 RepID=A0A446CK92_9BURK|nr:pilus assembly protein [Achromobacter agilis]SSW68337.1 hypothetical protein AGI3411_03525 [Achromobacter agilis]